MNKKNLILGIIILLFDQITKVLMINNNIIIIPQVLNFRYTQNIGAAFGIGTISIITILNILVVAGLIFFVIKENSKIKNITPYYMIIFGGISNLADRIFRGYVIDFIDVNFFNFPKFNIADICITIGVIFLIIDYIKNIHK